MNSTDKPEVKENLTVYETVSKRKDQPKDRRNSQWKWKQDGCGDGWCLEGEPEQLDERRIAANELVQTCRAQRFDLGHVLAHHQASHVPGRRAGDAEAGHVLPIDGESETELG